MLRRLIAPLMALALVSAACSSTTVISEGMLSAPADNASAQSSITGSDDASDPADSAGTEDSETDVRGDRDLGDSDAGNDADEPDGTDTTDENPVAENPAADDDFGLGGDDQLTGLVTDCEAGNNMACDILYSTSAVDSDEEQTALTCGGRSDVEVRFCTEGIDSAFGNVWFADTSPGLPAALTSCEDGDMTACDFLYFRSAIGSDYEEIGNTCGGRTTVAIPDCRTVFAADS